MKGLIVLSIYLIIMYIVTRVFTKKDDNVESFFVADRNIKTISSAMSIAATWIWAPSLFVSAERAYTTGLVGLFWFLIPNILCLIIFIPFAKRIREQMPEGITLSGYMKNKYDDKVKNVYLLQLIALSIFSTAVQLVAGAKIFSVITGLPYLSTTILLCIVAYSYSQFSGIRATVATDRLQLTYIVVACILLSAWLTKEKGGIDILMRGIGGISANYNNLFNKKGMEVFFAFGLPATIGLLSGPFGDQCFWQRAFAINKPQIGKAFSLGALLFAIVPICMGSIGFIAAGSSFIPKDISIINFEIISQALPSWTIIVFLFMITSGLLSTIDSNLCAVSSLTSDIFKKTNLKISRGSMIALLIIAILIANMPGLTVTHLFLFYGTLRASTLLPTVLTLKNVKLSARGVYIGVICSLVIGLPIFAYGNIYNLSLYKTIGSILTLSISGLMSLLIKERGGKYANS